MPSDTSIRLLKVIRLSLVLRPLLDQFLHTIEVPDGLFPPSSFYIDNSSSSITLLPLHVTSTSSCDNLLITTSCDNYLFLRQLPFYFNDLLRPCALLICRARHALFSRSGTTRTRKILLCELICCKHSKRQQRLHDHQIHMHLF